MNSRRLRCLAPALTLLLVAPAAAENEWFYNVSLTAANPTLDYFFPNMMPPHPDHKVLDAYFAIFNPGDTAVLEVDFDYTDANGSKVLVPVPQSPITILPRGTFPYLAGPVTLPFCPSEVSLHLKLVQGDFIEIQEGRFTHTCVPVPEPAATTLAVLGGLALVAAKRLRSRRP